MPLIFLPIASLLTMGRNFLSTITISLKKIPDNITPLQKNQAVRTLKNEKLKD
jgi:hypothetical protein